MRSRTVDIWMDFGCPFSRIAVGQIDEAQASFAEPLQVNLRVLRMDKNAPADYGQTTIEALISNEGCTVEQANRMLDRVRHFSAPFGVSYNFDIARGGQTLDAHRLVKLAALHNQHIPVALALFKGHFEDGKLMSDQEFLIDVAVKNLIPKEEVKELFATSRFIDEVFSDESEALANSVTNTPTLFFDGVISEIGAGSAAEYLAVLKATA